jgi:uncharacterized protein
MNNQEREVISDIFRRLEQVADQPRDPEAERFISEKLRQQPYAPYALAQAVYVQEQALANLHNRVQQLEAEIEELRSQPQQSGGLLASLFGGGPRQTERPQPMGAPFGRPPGMQAGMGGPRGPWGGQGMGGEPGPWGGQGPMAGQPGPFGGPQRGGSGFLGTALMTAAGVAGGMMLGNALMSAFGGQHGALGALGGGHGSEANAGGQDHSNLSPFQDSGNSGVQDASHDPSEDYGSDFGGDADGGDWS